MKLLVEENNVQPKPMELKDGEEVKLSLMFQPNGDVALCVRSKDESFKEAILWIEAQGDILLNKNNWENLKRLGFKIEKEHVEILNLRERETL